MNGSYNLATIETGTSLRDMCAAGWERLVGDTDLYLSPGWLGVEEQISSLTPTYLLATIDRRAAAGLTCYLLGADTPAWPFARIDAVLARLLAERSHPDTCAESLLPRLLPTLLCGGRRPGHSRLLLRPDLDEDDRGELVQQMLETAEEVGAQGGAASLSWLYVDDNDRLLRSALSERGYAAFPSAIASQLIVPPDFDYYLRSFQKSKRDTIRNERKKLAAAGIEYRARPLSEELISQILPLELALYEKYGTLFPPADAQRLHQAVSQLLGEQAQVLTAEQGGKVRGFIVLVRCGQTLFVRQCGFDYEFQGRLPLYFGLLFYAAIEYASAVGAHVLEYGISSEQAKASRGCQQRQQYGYVKVMRPEDHAAVCQLLMPLSQAGS